MFCILMFSKLYQIKQPKIIQTLIFEFLLDQVLDFLGKIKVVAISKKTSKHNHHLIYHIYKMYIKTRELLYRSELLFFKSIMSCENTK